MRLFVIRLKCLLRQKSNIFWTFFFPICLSVFFYMGFGNLSTTSVFSSINVFVASDKSDLNLISQMEAIKVDEEENLFLVNTEYEAEELENLMLEGKIESYIYLEEGEIIYRIRSNGLAQTITKSFLDQYIQISSLLENIEDPETRQAVLLDLMNSENYLEEVENNNNPKANFFVIYFYALIAMTCLFGSYWGIGIVKDIQADNSELGARVSVSPTPKLKLIITYFFAALLLHYLGNLGVITFLRFVLGIEFSKSIYLVMLASLVGCIAGISLGAMLSALIRASSSVKEGILTLISLLLSALSGLMFVQLKYIVNKFLPILGYINPANLLTDAFSSLYYYNSLDRYFFSLGLLSILSVVMLAITYFRLRGTRYDSV